MPSTSHSIATLLAAVFIAGCAARGVPPQVSREIERSDALIRQGCYRCLEEAVTVFERAAATRRGSGAAQRGAFEAAVMLAVRAKELGLPSEPLLGRARTFAQKLPPSQTSHLLDAAAWLNGELSGLDPEERQQRTGARTGSPPQRTALDAAIDTSLAAAYLALAVDCEMTPRPKIDGAAVLARHGGPPLMHYRAATCGIKGARFRELRAADPRWADTLYFEGRGGDPENGVELLKQARDAFPGSHAITLALARAQRATGDYEGALASVNAVIADVPEHRDALLGRLENLGHLQRYEDAVATASQMIKLGTWHMGDAYYWRAWNRLYLRQLDEAWADVERAVTLQSNATVFTLAGFIAHARKDLETAVDRFDRAFALQATNCIAAFSAGMVRVEQEAWPAAASAFSQSMSCYTTDVTAARAEIARIAASTDAPERKARLGAVQEKRLMSSEHLAAQSAFNAAQCYVRTGQKEHALAHAAVAAAHALLRERAASLQVVIEKMR